MSCSATLRIGGNTPLACVSGLPYCFDLGASFLQGLQPPQGALFPGESWSLRFWVGDAFYQSIDLTGAIILFCLKRELCDPVPLVRRSDVPLPGAIPPGNQIQIDVQAVDYGASGLIGRGWFELVFAATASEQRLLRGFLGWNEFDIRIFFGGVALYTTLMGRFQILQPVSYLDGLTLPPPPTPATAFPIYNCPVTVNPLDIVYLSAADTVDRASAASITTAPALGFVTSKPTPTTCTVLFTDLELTGFVGLIPTVDYFLGIGAGTITDDVSGFVSGNVVQAVGVARNPTTLVVEIDRDYTILS